MLQINRDLRCQNHIAFDFQRARDIDAGRQIQFVAANGQLPQVTRKTVLGREQNLVLAGDFGFLRDGDAFKIHRQTGRAQIHIVEHQAVHARRPTYSQNAGGFGKDQVVNRVPVLAGQAQHAVAFVAETHLVASCA